MGLSTVDFAFARTASVEFSVVVLFSKFGGCSNSDINKTFSRSWATIFVVLCKNVGLYKTTEYSALFEQMQNQQYECRPGRRHYSRGYG